MPVVPGKKLTGMKTEMRTSEVAMTALYLVFGPFAGATSYRTAFLATGVVIGVIGALLVLWRLVRRRTGAHPT